MDEPQIKTFIYQPVSSLNFFIFFFPRYKSWLRRGFWSSVSQQKGPTGSASSETAPEEQNFQPLLLAQGQKKGRDVKSPWEGPHPSAGITLGCFTPNHRGQSVSRLKLLGSKNQKSPFTPPKEDLEDEKLHQIVENWRNRMNFWADRLPVCAKHLVRDRSFLDKCSFQALDHTVNPSLMSHCCFSISPQDTEQETANCSHELLWDDPERVKRKNLCESKRFYPTSRWAGEAESNLHTGLRSVAALSGQCQNQALGKFR